MTTSVASLLESRAPAHGLGENGLLIVRVLALVCGAGGLLVLVGWTADLAPLQSLGLNWQPMKPGAALCCLLLASSLWVSSHPLALGRTRSSVAFDGTRIGAATAAAALALLMLIRYALHSGVSPGGAIQDGMWIPPTPALAIIGLGALAAGSRLLSAKLYWTVSAAVLALAISAAAEQALGAPQLQPGAPSMTLAIVLLAAGLCLVRVEDGPGRLLHSISFGGTLARWLLPASLLVPLCVSLLVVHLLGVAGPGGARALCELSVGMTLAAATLAWFVADRTDRECARASDRISRLARICEATTNAVVITDADGIIDWINDGFTQMTGYTLVEAAGRTPGTLLQGPATDPTEVRRIGAAMRDRQSINSELVNYTKDGRPYWACMKIEPLRGAGNAIDGFMAIESDVTERRERNKILDLLTSRFNLATRAAGIGVYDRDSGGAGLWWSDVMYEIFARSKQEFRPSMDAWCAMIHPEDLPRVQRLSEVAARAGTTLDIRYRIIRPDGSVRHLQSISSSPEDAELSKSRRIGVLLDVTDRIESERRERVLEVQLKESFHHSGIAETANGVLQSVEQALSGVGVAASVMRRDLTALRPERVAQVATLIANNRTDIAGFLAEDVRGKYLPDYLLAIGTQLGADTRSLETGLAEIDKCVHHLRDIISAQQSLIPMGGMLEPTDLRDLVEVALLVQAPDIARVEIVRRFEDLPLITTDRHKLLKIIVSFVSNARDALLLGGSEPPRILVEVCKSGDEAVFSIEDTGPGMSPDVMAHLWEFGFTTKRNGRGVGLHASAIAAREIGATVSAHSDGHGRGARFSVRLPLG
ncbi:MAG: PAS domain S-box protein [Steroidobacteraceae bacterium]|jgi:PAS domain S-box-containing protein